MTHLIVERVLIVEAYINTGLIKESCEIFGRKFLGKGIPAETATQALVKKWRAKGSMANALTRRPPSVRTPEFTDYICRRIMQRPKKSTCKLLQQAHVSRPTCLRALNSQDL
jgi:hypothetical protein